MSTPTPFHYPLDYPLSISRVRTMLTCGAAYKLLYIDRHTRWSGASAWYGSLVHAVLRKLAEGTPLKEAHAQVWASFCGEVVTKLVRWEVLDSLYAKSGRPTTLAAKKWREEHPEYDALQEDIAAYQRETLSHIRWGQASLAHLYRQSCRILTCEQELLPQGILLIEGRVPSSLGDLREAESLAVRPSDEEVHGELEENGVAERDYALLSGMLYDIPVNGVPDLVACVPAHYLQERLARSGMALPDDVTSQVNIILDYKTGKKTPPERLSVDAQLLLYYHLCLQNFLIDSSLSSMLGHVYVQEDGTVTWSFVDTSQYQDMLPQLYEQFRLIATHISNEEFSPVSNLLSFGMDRCKMCDVSHICPDNHL